ncbi:MAG: hypothetical protein KGM42_02200 [Hyphomicrobiales bacterium]|nr:hypothetical protein [Hyphomicrobiales bacterium]
MIRTLVVGLFAAIVALGSSYAAISWTKAKRDAAPAEQQVKLTQKKTRMINVPLVVNGQVQGYVMAQFGYVADEKDLAALSAPVEPILLDEAFRMIYADDKNDFRKLRKADLGSMTADLKDRVSKRLGSNALRDVLIEDFNYVSKDDIRQ